MRYAERLKVRQEQEREQKLQSRKRARRWKRNAGLPATCYLCKKQMTYGELLTMNAGKAHPNGVNNRCEPCFDKESAEMDYSAEPRYAGEDIFWRLSCPSKH